MSSPSHQRPIAGPSRPVRPSPQAHRPMEPLIDLLGSSPDYGDFTSAPDNIASDDLLGSFEEDRTAKHSTHRLSTAPSQVGSSSHQLDLLGDDILRYEGSPFSQGGHTDWPEAKSAGRDPIHVRLPPRPDEMPADYAPPLRSPRRLSHLYSFAGPSSPPQITDVGADIVFHPTHVPRQSEESSFDNHSSSLLSSSPAHSRLLNTFTTTAKLASKWRSTVDHHNSSPPTYHRGLSDSTSPAQHSSTAASIDITHSTPFANSERLAGVYIPPSGAPGFVPQPVTARGPGAVNAEYTGTVLLGRRDSSLPVLTGVLADSLRQHLPSRQRLSGKWSLLFSLDQHGASLATLYRLVDKYAIAHQGAGNVLIVQDGEGHLFGSYINEAIVRREGSYYGGGESFLFKLGQSSTQDIQVFRWTGRNQYFALCETDFLSFGGGSGTYGLVLDSSFSHNSSATCPTFDNDILSTGNPVRTSHATKFECIGLEVWGTQ